MTRPSYRPSQALARTALLLSLALPTTTSAKAVDPAVGDYDAGGVDSVVRLRLDADGSFAFALMAGSLDQQARGRWERRGDTIHFFSVPRPVPPVVEPGPITQRADGPFEIRVVGPGGNDLAGIDFSISFDRGDALTAYSPGGPWAFPADEHRQPRSISFVMPQYGLNTTGLPLTGKAGTTATFVLRPNDFGTIDFTGSTATVTATEMTLCGEGLGGRESGCHDFRRIEP